MLPALLEESASTPRRSRVRDRLGLGVVVALSTAGLVACGGGERQDESEAEGEYPVEIVSAEFPAQQRLAQTSELVLEVRNAGEETIPDLAVTVFTAPDAVVDVGPEEAESSDDAGETAIGTDGEEIPEGDLDAAVDQALQEELDQAAAEDDGEDTDAAEEEAASDEPRSEAAGAFSVLSEQEGLAIPSRPVWILEQGYPKQAEAPPTTPPGGEIVGGSGAEAAQTNTFSFGALEPDDSFSLVWQVTPVQAGEYTVRYRLAAGLQGNAVAVNEDGSVPEGEFVVVIDDAPPQTRVDDNGKVVPIKPDDLIGQAGSDDQQSELQP